MLFDWDAGNVLHIARHSVTPDEAEDVILIEPLEIDIQDHESEARVLCFGRTRSGRLLTVLYAIRRNKVRVVTAYDMTKNQMVVYLKGF